MQPIYFFGCRRCTHVGYTCPHNNSYIITQKMQYLYLQRMGRYDDDPPGRPTHFLTHY